MDLRSNLLEHILIVVGVSVVLLTGLAYGLEFNRSGPPQIGIVTKVYEMRAMRAPIKRSIVLAENGQTWHVTGKWKPGTKVCFKVKTGLLSGDQTAMALPNSDCGQGGPMASGW